MNKIRIADETLKLAAKRRDISLTFREKAEIAKLSEKMGVDSLELPMIRDIRTDSLLVKTISAVIRKAVLTLPVELTEEGCDIAWEAIKTAAHPRLQVCIPVSPVQMEYFCHKKAPAILDMITRLTTQCAENCPDVEFCAEDATRSEPDFLYEAIRRAVAAGAKTVTLCDSAGTMLPSEFAGFINEIKNAVPETESVTLGIRCADTMHMACACAAACASAGAGELKTSTAGFDSPAIGCVADFIRMRGDSCGFCSGLHQTVLHRLDTQIQSFIQRRQEIFRPDTEQDIFNGNYTLTKDDDISVVTNAVIKLGYELNDEDNRHVYEAFRQVAEKKNISMKELDAIVASSAMQVPPTYKIKRFLCNSGNVISATANVEIEKDGIVLQGISLGDGPIDAAFLAIEQIVGTHYELDDFRIRSVTHGREAVGNAVIRLRANGKLYSGNGISTDIVGAAIRAYLNALNKIVYEENAV